MTDEATACCPPSDRLAELLVDHVTPQDRNLLEDHLATCESCQHTLEELATGPWDWETWARRLKGSQVAWPPGPRRREEGPTRWPCVPGYEILAEIGRGGMGVVYKARKIALDSLVALKVIRSSQQGNPDYCQRFRQEARIVAQLRHPNIVLVFDYGESGEWTYLTLELVEGGTLTQLLQDRPLPAREAAQLVEALARAVHSAHQLGIIHRDLKPANVLLAAVPGDFAPGAAGVILHGEKRYLPKVSDFGLARHGERPGVTQSGDVMGTPEYMAPEQARASAGWSTPAVDIYGLGAILYEALTGRPPFRAETALATMCLISDTEPVPPASLQPTLPRDLETITLKCLRKAPGDRYPTALALADDLHRFLAGEPITARPIPVWVRATKWARRHPVVAMLGMLSGVLLLGMLAVWIHFTAHLRAKNVELDELNTALMAESELVQEKHRETERKQQTIDEQQRKIDDNLADAARGVQAYYELIRADRQLRSPVDDVFRMRVLTRTLATYSDLVKLLEGRERLRLECARVYHFMSGMSQELGRADDANTFARRAIAIWDTLPAEALRDPRHALEPGFCRVDLGNMAFIRQQYAEAEKWYRQAIAVYLACKPTTSIDRAQREYQIALTRNLLGYLLFHPRHRKLPEAEAELKAAERSIRDALKLNNIALSRILASQIETNRGMLLESRDQWAEARVAYERAVSQLEEEKQPYYDNIDFLSALVGAYRRLGLWYRRHGAWDDALTNLRKGIELRARLLAGQPRILRHRYELGVDTALIAELHRKAGRESDATQEYHRAIPHLLESAKQAPKQWDYVRSLGEVVVLSSRLDVKLGNTLSVAHIEAATKFLRPFAERQNTRDAAGKLLGELERLRKLPEKASTTKPRTNEPRTK
jgi:tetratricopeptide (TPR) repeat protein